MVGVERIKRNVWKKRLEEYAETRFCSVELVKESVFIWRTMVNHEKFLRLGAYSLSKKKNHCCLSCEDSTYSYDFSLNVLYNPAFISIILSLARFSRKRTECRDLVHVLYCKSARR